MSKKYSDIWGGGGGACAKANITFFSDKTDTVFRVGTIFNRFNFSGLSLAFILTYYLICGEKLIKLAFENSVKLAKS